MPFGFDDPMLEMEGIEGRIVLPNDPPEMSRKRLYTKAEAVQYVDELVRERVIDKHVRHDLMSQIESSALPGPMPCEACRRASFADFTIATDRVLRGDPSQVAKWN